MGVVLNSEVFRCRAHRATFGHSHGGHGHSHGGQGHSHGDQGRAEEGHGHHRKKHKKNINVRAAFIHVIGDLIQSIGVLVAAFIIKYYVSMRSAHSLDFHRLGDVRTKTNL